MKRQITQLPSPVAQQPSSQPRSGYVLRGCTQSRGATGTCLRATPPWPYPKLLLNAGIADFQNDISDAVGVRSSLTGTVTIAAKFTNSTNAATLTSGSSAPVPLAPAILPAFYKANRHRLPEGLSPGKRVVNRCSKGCYTSTNQRERVPGRPPDVLGRQTRLPALSVAAPPRVTIAAILTNSTNAAILTSESLAPVPLAPAILPAFYKANRHRLPEGLSPGKRVVNRCSKGCYTSTNQRERVPGRPPDALGGQPSRLQLDCV